MPKKRKKKKKKKHHNDDIFERSNNAIWTELKRGIKLKNN